MKTWYKMQNENQKKIRKNNFFQKKIEIFFFWDQNEKKCGKIIIQKQKMPYFLPKKNLKFQNTKNRKNWIFSCLLCVHSKFFYETTLWCYVVLQKIFHDFLIRSGYLKFCSKKFPPKKRLYRRNFEKKNFEKNRKIQIFGRSAEIGQIFLGVKFVCIRRICNINI